MSADVSAPFSKLMAAAVAADFINKTRAHIYSARVMPEVREVYSNFSKDSRPIKWERSSVRAARF